MGVYLKTALHSGYMKRQQVMSGSRKKLNLIARFKYYLLRDHLQMQRHGDGGFVLELSNYGVGFWRHGDDSILARRQLIAERMHRPHCSHAS